jgi:type IV fimbrial biogenesis protein FimT
MKRTDAGFTLVELMVVLVVAGILLSIAVPSFQNMIRVNRMAAAANDFTFALMRARTEALKLGQNVVVCGSKNPEAAQPSCTGDWSSGWIVFADNGPTANNNYDAGETLLLVRGKLEDSYSVTANVPTGSGVYIAFRPQGAVAGTIGNFEIKDSNYGESTRLICIGITGSARVLTKKSSSSGCTCTAAQNCV